MQAIREIIDIKANRLSYRLPAGFFGAKVELILLPIEEKKAETLTPSKRSRSLLGSLRQFANTDLIPEENQAWIRAAGIKDEAR